jgi:ABC-type Mn2+/Zn2+ transport system permease subunit
MILIAVSMGIAAAFIGWFLSTYYTLTWRPEILRVLDIKMYYNETDGS